MLVLVLVSMIAATAVLLEIVVVIMIGVIERSATVASSIINQSLVTFVAIIVVTTHITR